jgi:hypothetical protein
MGISYQVGATVKHEDYPVGKSPVGNAAYPHQEVISLKE